MKDPGYEVAVAHPGFEFFSGCGLAFIITQMVVWKLVTGEDLSG